MGGETLPLLGRYFARSLWPPLKNPGYTIGIAKGALLRAIPLVDRRVIKKRRGEGDWYLCYTKHNLSLIKAVLIHKFSKNLPTVGLGTHPLPHLPPPPPH